MSSMIVIGLTGNMGVGKSEAAAIFKSLGAKIIDADKVGHKCADEPGCVKQLVEKFGDHILIRGKVDRVKLGKIVFDDDNARKAVLDIFYPAMEKDITNQVARYKTNKRIKVVVLDAALLLEAGWDRFVDLVFVVKANKDLQIKRIQQRMDLTKADIERRLRVQMPMKEKIKQADYVIDNRSTINNLKKQINDIYKNLKNII